MKTAKELRDLVDLEKQLRRAANLKVTTKWVEKIIKKKCEPKARKGYHTTTVKVPFVYGRANVANILTENGYEVHILADQKIKICW